MMTENTERSGRVQALLELWRREPARVVAAVASLLALVVAFGVEISTDQVDAILAVIPAIALLLGGGEVVRHQVTAPATLAREHDRLEAVLLEEAVPAHVVARARRAVGG